MGAHVRNTMPTQQHIRNMHTQHIRSMRVKPANAAEDIADKVVTGVMGMVGQENKMQPKQSLGWFIAGMLLALLLVYIFAVYKGWVKNPLKNMGKAGNNVAPASHLQYFFF